MPVEDVFGNLKVGDRFFIPALFSAYIKTSEHFAMDEVSHIVYQFEPSQYVVKC